MSTNQYYATQRFEEAGTPVTLDRNENHTIFDNKIVLDTIPDEFQKVIVTSINGLSTNEMVEIPYYEDITDVNEFKVDYKVSGFVYFHSSREAQSIGVEYKGKGYVCIMPNRIATIVSEDGKTILQTLDQLTNEAQNQANYAKTEGDYAKQQGNLANTTISNANNMTDKINNETLMIYKNSVTNYADIETTYPTPQNGWTVVVTSQNTRYRYNSTLGQWVDIDTAPYDSIGDLSKISSTNLIDEIKLNTDKIGILSGLNTQNKTDLVGAINENVASLNDIPNQTFITEKAKTVDVNNATANLQNQISNMGSASPKGSYATLAALQTAYPTGTTGTYVVTADGNWYYWNGTAWAVGGAYQSTQISRKTVVPEKTNFISLGKNLFDKDTAVLGYVNGSGGVGTSPDTYVSDYIPVDPNTIYYRTEKVLQVGFYDINKTFISAIGYNVATDNTLTTPSNCYYMRVTVPQAILSTYQLELGSVGTTYEKYGYKFAKSFLTTMETSNYGDNTITESKVVNKNGKLIFDNTTKYITVDFKNLQIIIPTGTYLLTSSGITSITAQTIDISTYVGNTYNFIINKTTKAIKIQTASTAMSDKDDYIILAFYKNGDSVASFNPYVVVKSSGATSSNIIENSSSYFGLKLTAYGDSITNHPNWHNLVKSALGFGTVYNRGWSDSAVTMENKTLYINADGTYNSNPLTTSPQPVGTTEVQCSFCNDDRISYVPTDSDVILVMGGTNDLFRNQPIGDTSYTGDSVYNETTFSGALVSTVKKLQARVPNALIVLMTPIINVDANGSNKPRVNSLNLKIYDYVDAVKKVAEYTGCPLIDVHNCGINLFNTSLMLGDGTHPTSTGDTMIARTVVGGLKAIAPVS